MRSSIMEGIRWAFKSEAWKPTKNEWLMALSCIQLEEKERIQKFVFKKDAKSSLIGRLLLRKTISELMKIPYAGVKLGRTEKGKPFLVNEINDPRLKSFSLNVSHQGDYTVLAAELFRQVGIDVMKTVSPSGTSVPEFFHIMRKQFTPAEWLIVKNEGTEWEQMQMFYRHWSLKESYVKAVGVGIGHDLQKIEFKIETPHLSKEAMTYDSSLRLSGQKVDDWVFEETKLDDLHQVAVAVGSTSDDRSIQLSPMSLSRTGFQVLTFSEVISNAESLRPLNQEDWTAFQSKKEARKR